GAPERFRLVEVGPGDGTLMSDALRAARLVPGFLEACDLILIEPSAPLRDLQAKALAGADLSPRWVRSLTAIETDAPVILIANEVLDCMPAR
ncbi:SAM-dependent methyltransferase, partial [Halomonas sp. ND22Bw]